MNERQKEKASEIQEELERVTGLYIAKNSGIQLMNLRGLEGLFAESSLQSHPHPKKRPKDIFQREEIYFGGSNLTNYKKRLAAYLDFWLPEIKGNCSFSMPVYLVLLAYCETKARN